MVIPQHPSSRQSAIIGELPVMWANTYVIAGDVDPHLAAPVGSIYIYLDRDNSQATAYIKDNDAGADADWAPLNTP